MVQEESAASALPQVLVSEKPVVVAMDWILIAALDVLEKVTFWLGETV